MDILLIGFLTFLSSIVGTLGGFGASTIMVAALSLYYPLPQVLLLVAIIHWFEDLWKMVLFRKGIRWRLILGFGIPGVAASYAGARMTVAAPQQVILAGFGVILVAYSIYLVLNPVFRLPPNLGTAAAGGCASGFMAGILGVGGAARGLFLAAFDLPKAVYIATSGGIAVIIDSARIATYFAERIRLADLPAAGLAVYIPVSFAGALVARYLEGFIDQKHYRSLVALLLGAIGIKFLFFGQG